MLFLTYNHRGLLKAYYYVNKLNNCVQFDLEDDFVKKLVFRLHLTAVFYLFAIWLSGSVIDRKYGYGSLKFRRAFFDVLCL